MNKGFYGIFMGSVALCTVSDTVIAQDDDDKMVIDEIIVTGQKRPATMQKAPIAVSAFTSEGLDKENVIRLEGMSSKAPGLIVAKSEGFRRVVAIRGLGLEAAQNDIANPSVSFHMDGVYIASDLSLNTDFIDVERIEVMRGPQGTVFGQNSIGGTINLVSKMPNLDEVEMEADVTVGNYDLMRTRGMVNVPLSDTLAVRGAVSYYKHDGFSENVLLGTGLDDEDNFNTRVQLLWQPSDTFSAIVRGQYYDTAELGGRAQKSIFDTTPGRDVAHDYKDTFEATSAMIDLTLEWDLDWGTVKSISSWQDMKVKQEADNDRSSAPIDIVFDRNRDVDAWTSELNVVSNSEDSTFDWIVGAFYLNFSDRSQFLEFGDFNFDGVIDTAIDTSNPFGHADLGFQTDTTPTRESWSAFAQATKHLSDDLRVTGGVRYTDDQVTSDINNFFGFDTKTSEASSTNVTGKIDVQYDLSDSNMVYASVSRGSKPGGVNLTSGASVPAVYESESAWAYEFGSKNRFLDNSVQVNFAAFYYDYKNMQFQDTDPVPFNGGVNNIPKARVMGAEVEFSAILSEQFRIDGNLSYLDTEITGDVTVLDSVAAIEAHNEVLADGFGFFSPESIAVRAAQQVNAIGNPLPKAPDFSANIAITYDQELADFGVLSTQLQYTYRDSYQYRIYSSGVRDTVSSYDLLNLSVMLEPDDSNWTAEFLMTNLTNSQAVNSRFTDSFGVGATGDEFVAPRQYMFRVAYKF